MTVQITLPKFNTDSGVVINLDAMPYLNLLDVNEDAQQIIHLRYEDKGECKYLLTTGVSDDEVVGMYILLLGIFNEYEIDDFNISKANEEIRDVSDAYTSLRYLN